MSFKSSRAGERVLNFGDSGTEFYIIIKGIVSVMTPNKSITHWRQKRFDFLQDLQWYKEILLNYYSLLKAQSDEYEKKYQGSTFPKQLTPDWYNEAINGNIGSDLYNDIIKELNPDR